VQQEKRFEDLKKFKMEEREGDVKLCGSWGVNVNRNARFQRKSLLENTAREGTKLLTLCE